jgi:IS30 family transposase
MKLFMPGFMAENRNLKNCGSTCLTLKLSGVYAKVGGRDTAVYLTGFSIHERPKAIADRQEFGHWEGDLMSFRKNSQHILVLRERQTMFIQSALLTRKTADLTADRLMILMENSMRLR